MDRPVTVVIFEGGQAQTSLDKTISYVRSQVVLDTLSKLALASEIDRVILVTNNAEFCRPSFRPSGGRL